MRHRTLVCLAASALLIAACSSSSGPGGAPAAVDAGDPVAFSTAPTSCVYNCDPACSEWSSDYACPSLGAWSAIPHDTTCPAWDGTYPQPTATACTATSASGDSIAYAGVDPNDAARFVLPDGRRVKAAGSEWIFSEPEIQPNAPVNVIQVPGTNFLLVVDMGYDDHAVRVLDATKIAGGSPMVSHVSFPIPHTLNSPVAFIAPDLVLVATGDGVVQALKLDTATGTLTQDDARSITLPASVDDRKNAAPYFVGGMAVSPDGARIVVTSMFDTKALVYGLTQADYGTQIGTVDIGAGGSFACAFDPTDTTGQFAYVSMWGGHKVQEIDLSTPASPKVSRSFAIEKDPEGLAFLDGRWLAVANSLGDAIALVDRTSGTVTPVPVDVKDALPAHEPTTLAYDATKKQLYATLADANAVAAWSVDTSKSPPALTPLGLLPTSWWPSSVAVMADGSLAITSMRGHSNGPLQQQFPPDDGTSMHGVRGAIQLVPVAAQDFAAGETAVRAYDDVGGLAGAPVVSCPNGENDFPLPATNTEGPSKQIDHIIFILRENKTFDGVLGDLPGVNGDPSLAMKTDSANMDRLWPNFRGLVRMFATSDDYYTDAELSNQGHTWTTFGRQTDFDERMWPLNGYSRNGWTSPVQPQGIADIGRPIEGSIFDWLENVNVPLAVFGEAEGVAHSVPGQPSANDFLYPAGLVQNIGFPDVQNACYVAGRMRVLCNLPSFVYQTLPNDHTQGVSPTQASPELMIATNDEATGMMVEALSHSPLWAKSLIVVTEDDPANGGDHVDHHRTPILFAGPWIKHGYVSKQHIDVTSLHKMIANIFGVAYPNALVEHAALPLDLFSSTPDFTPFDHTARIWPATCGTTATIAERRLWHTWEMDDVDDQPGLDAQVTRYLRGEQLQTLPPALERRVKAREKWQKAASALDTDDDDRR